MLAAVGDLSGSGGTERQFSDLFDDLRKRQPGQVDLITAGIAVKRLREAGRLASTDGIIALPLGERPAQGRLGQLRLTLQLLWVSLWRQWDVVHLCQPTPSYLPFAALITRLPRRLRPRITMTVVDCTLAHNLENPAGVADPYEQQVVDAHMLYHRWARLDGMFSWYQAFVDAASRLSLFPGVLIRAADYCFTNVERFKPGTKQPLAVFAGRFSTQKRPLLFVDAIASLFRRNAALASRWQFAMYGGGSLEPEVRARIAAHGLTDRIELARTPDMAPVFARSKLFVSTQAYENFTSQAMLEAMAAGNAIVAENAGQTGEFVRNGENGYAVGEPATADTLADAISDYLAHPERHGEMAAASSRIATQVHTIEHFAEDITAFWTAVSRS